MAGRLTKKKINDIWRSGYCRKTVNYAKKTEDTLQGSDARVEFLKKHIQECMDCFHASLLKREEANVAEEIGPQAYGAFMCGEDVTKRPSYDPQMSRKALERIQNEGYMTSEFMEWLIRVSQRIDYRTQKNAKT